MARTQTLDKPVVVRLLGVVMLAAMVGAVFATYAVFTKAFSGDVPVTVQARSAGLQLNDNADVKLRGVIVGRVEDVTIESGEPEIHLRIDPDHQAQIPSDVEALVVPKTLFGEKFVDLQPVTESAGTAIEAGDVIVQAELPAEIETLLIDLDPLLEALNPAELSYTLTALSEALEGQGETIGQSIETLEAYLQKITPLAPEIMEDVTALGEAAQTYAEVMPEIGSTLRNAVVTGDTLVGRRAQLQSLFVETTAFAATADAFLQTTGEDFITLTRESQPTLDLLAEYSPTIGCVLEGLDTLKPTIDSVVRDHRVHATINIVPRTSREYDNDDAAETPGVAEGPGSFDPTCSGLPDPGLSAANPADGLPDSALEALGITGELGKTKPLASPTTRLSPVGTALEEEQIDALLAPALGTTVDDVPDVAPALVGPALRGAEVTLG
ncbi:phospholipid/cholesterol/gamma-HCH transport system substrate-binding protein [Mumia flava]|uniref:Phospholipid/cholesterol/gamma-HCH transport system substrate-binding protein n=1 Tax=Mumia flava TaxID=1348852 RepID=A0A0B2BME5_9ACTN|nr:MCE family protein [Mumia flava]PJJ58294.1 phospholipid/cholesterol/gamma-HCH transport system substrate-binding protein [Mumia flava]